MAQNNRTTFYIDGKFETQDVLKGASAIENALKKIENPKIRTQSIEKTLNNVKTRAAEMAERVKQGFKSPKELEKFTSDLERLRKDYGKLTKFNSEKLLIPSDSILQSDKALEEYVKKISELQEKLKNVNKGKNAYRADTSGFAGNKDLEKNFRAARKGMNEVVARGGSKDEMQAIVDKYTATSGTGMKAYNAELQKMFNFKSGDPLKESRDLIVEITDKTVGLETETNRVRIEYQQTGDTAKRALDESKVAIDDTSKSAEKLGNSMRRSAEASRELENFGQRLKYLTSIGSIMMLARRAIRQIFTDIKDLDTAFNEISVVTGKTMDEMWSSFSQVNQIAQEYGVTSKGVVEVQNMYYHQGMNDIQVNKMTAETLTLAKIAGLEYADATDKMTAALNAFNIAAEDASKITDVTAALASSAAASSEEIMNALTKTASISASAGTSLENTEVFLTKMISDAA